jgi:hypothetical protein
MTWWDYDRAEFRLYLIRELASEITAARSAMAVLAGLARNDADGPLLANTLLLVSDQLGERANWLANQAEICNGTPLKPYIESTLLHIGEPDLKQ